MEDLRSNLQQISPVVDEVVVERALPYKRSRLGRQLEEVHEIIVFVCPEAIWIDASAWKNTEFKYCPVPRGTTPHEKDAIRIAKWYLMRFEAVQLDEVSG